MVSSVLFLSQIWEIQERSKLEIWLPMEFKRILFFVETLCLRLTLCSLALVMLVMFWKPKKPRCFFKGLQIKFSLLTSKIPLGKEICAGAAARICAFVYYRGKCYERLYNAYPTLILCLSLSLSDSSSCWSCSESLKNSPDVFLKVYG